MKITIVGAGAMGCLIGGYLTRSAQDVVLVDLWAEHVEALNRVGLRIWEGEDRLTIPVRAVLAGEAIRPAELVLFAVKAYQTAGAAPSVPGFLAEDGCALTLQNGLGSADVLAASLGRDRVLVGATAQGATRLGPGEIRHGGSGETLLGGYSGVHPRAEAVAEALSGAGMTCRAVRDVWPAVWKKLAVNCGINAVTALTGIRNGRIPEIPEASDLLRDAVREAAAVSRAAGIDLGDPEALGDAVLSVARATAANRSSMGQDVDHRNPTEIDFINGAIVREGERHGVPTPTNATLWRLVKTLEEVFRGGINAASAPPGSPRTWRES